MTFTVIKPGLFTTVQDEGRFGFQQYGVITSGAVDRVALRLANVLVGNEQGAAALEATMVGPELVWNCPSLFAVCGADLSPTLDGVPVPLWKTIAAPAGSRLRFGKSLQGCRAYIAVGGGIDVPLVMNSRSTYVRAEIGGWQGRPLHAGDMLPIGRTSVRTEKLARALREKCGTDEMGVSGWSVSRGLIPRYGRNPVVSVIAGQEQGWFDEESQRRFYSEAFELLPQSDRMGYRLKGSALRLKESREMISSAVTFGTVQVPPDGNPIVLMADHQTTGGYPKIAQVIGGDLSLLAQLQPGDTVRFAPVPLREAQQAALIHRQGMRLLQIGLDQMIGI